VRAVQRLESVKKGDSKNGRSHCWMVRTICSTFFFFISESFCGAIDDSHQVHVDVRAPRNPPHPHAVHLCRARVVGEQSGAVIDGCFGEVRSGGKALGHGINGPLKVQSSLGGTAKTQK
jgi:hypothetical protein